MNEMQLLGKESSIHVQTVVALPKDYEDCAELLSSQHAKEKVLFTQSFCIQHFPLLHNQFVTKSLIVLATKINIILIKIYAVI